MNCLLLIASTDQAEQTAVALACQAENGWHLDRYFREVVRVKRFHTPCQFCGKGKKSGKMLSFHWSLLWKKRKLSLVFLRTQWNSLPNYCWAHKMVFKPAFGQNASLDFAQRFFRFVFHPRPISVHCHFVGSHFGYDKWKKTIQFDFSFFNRIFGEKFEENDPPNGSRSKNVHFVVWTAFISNEILV